MALQPLLPLALEALEQVAIELTAYLARTEPDEYVKQAGQMPGLRAAAAKLGAIEPAAVAAAMEFVLEGLHLGKKLNKDVQAGRYRYRS